MMNKAKSLTTIHTSKQKADSIYEKLANEFDYGPLSMAKKFDGTHPKVMEE